MNGIRKKRKKKACILTHYQDLLVFSTFEDIKMVCVLTPYQDVLVLSPLKDIKWLDLMIVWW